MSQASVGGVSDAAPTRMDVVGGWLVEVMYRLGPGDLAELRRLDTERPSAPRFWQLVASMPDADGDVPWRAENERRFAVVLRTFAELRAVHRTGKSLGSALAGAGLDERRVLQLLRARRAALAHAIRTICHFLTSKGQAVDAMGFARLVLSEDAPGEEQERRRVARDYFGDIARAERRAQGENR